MNARETAAARDAIRRALDEDVGAGDVTTEACVDADRHATGRFLARQNLVLAGTGILELVYEAGGGGVEVSLLHRDGDTLSDNDVIAVAKGPARRLLTMERVSLNFLQRLSGVATLAAQFVDRVKGTRTRILDTRKTTPGLRLLEKMAAAAGGVRNHRIGLFDAILIKNNHIAAAGGVAPAFKRALEYLEAHPEKHGMAVEIEVRTPEEVEEALCAGAKHMLLDNFSPAQARDIIEKIGGKATVELSGGITLDNVRAYAEAGAAYISSGSITHSAPAVDISFRLEW
jgi:nicotinate-nucleotide pyrophosphorylase (carboxylating)